MDDVAETTEKSLTIENTVLSYNTAGSSGGAIYVENNSDFSMTGGVIRNNHVTGEWGSGEGGGIYLGSYDGIDPSYISGVNIFNNTACTSGGGIASWRSIDLDGCTDIHDNAALDGRGGGVYLWDGTITYSNVSIGNNTASNGGDGVYRVAGTSRAGDGDWWYGGNTEVGPP